MPIFIQKPNRPVYPLSKFYFYVDSSQKKANKFDCPYGVFQDNNGFLHTEPLTTDRIKRYGRKGIICVSYPRYRK